ncbi:MAG: hypothetical protein NT154_04425 [Verrucomicrobia bacterium]|nr:hypothetical protein [Verrucomicrobiota bacterium]
MAILVVIVIGSLLARSALAQETNLCLPLPATKLEAFETNTDTVIIKATAPIGAVPAHSGTVSVRCREITDVGTSRRESGIIIDIAFGGPLEDVMLIDYDELDSLLDGLEYLGKLDWTITPLPGFDAVYTTKGGFRAAAFGSRRTGNIEFAVRSMRVVRSPLLLSRDQLGQVRSLVEQGKAKLDSLRKEK